MEAELEQHRSLVRYQPVGQDLVALQAIEAEGDIITWSTLELPRLSL